MWKKGRKGFKYNEDKGLKQCSICKLILPIGDFRVKKDNTLGVAAQCKKCKGGAHRETINGLIFDVTYKGVRYNAKEELKECRKCGEVFHKSNFHLSKLSILGVSNTCKQCSRKYTVKRHRTIKADPARVAIVRENRHKYKYVPSTKSKASYKQRSKDSTIQITRGHISRVLTSRMNFYNLPKCSVNDIPPQLYEIARYNILLKRVITNKIKSDKMKQETKDTKAIVEVVKRAFKPIDYDQFHDAKKLNTILMTTLERITDPEPTITVGEAMAVAKLADMMIKNTLVELKKQQVATLITHIGVGNNVLGN